MIRLQQFRNRRSTLVGYVFFTFMCMSLAYGQLPERKVIKSVKPDYPAVLREKLIGGTVKLKVRIKADGTVKGIEAIGGNSILITSAQTAVMQWRFAPAESETNQEVSLVFNPRTDK